MKLQRAALMTVAVLSLTACRTATTTTSLSTVPAAPDYSDTSQWFVVDRSAGVDLFYIVSTNIGDYLVDSVVQHYADVHNDDVRGLLQGEMRGIDRMLSGKMNYFSPYYRQCSLETFASDSLVAERIPLAMDDVKRAFRYYMDHLNNGRPFILAGFSQGAIAVVELLKEMDDKAARQLVAAYVIGWKVTAADMASSPYIVAARDSNDVGVTVCFNSVRTPDCSIPLISDGNSVAINPVNWRTDATPAQLTVGGDTLTIVLDTATKLLCVDGYKRDDYMLPLIGRDGNYHRLDITLYSSYLKRNMALRAERF